MTEIEKLKADLTMLAKARDCLKRHECPNVALGVQSICDLMKKNIADLEAQQQKVDPWKKAKDALYHWDVNDIEPDEIGKRSVFAYVQSLQAKVGELNHELRCERIDGGKVRDDLKAQIVEMQQHGRKVDQANHEHYGRLQDQIAIRDLKIEKLERQISEPAERNRQKLAELTTILNAIPLYRLEAACGLARELVEKWIESVKREMQR